MKRSRVRFLMLQAGVAAGCPAGGPSPQRDAPQEPARLALRQRAPKPPRLSPPGLKEVLGAEGCLSDAFCEICVVCRLGVRRFVLCAGWGFS
jgi:hypothetical protein